MKPHELWQGQPFEVQEDLQRLLFPDGIRFDGEVFRTADCSVIFDVLGDQNPRQQHWRGFLNGGPYWNRVEPGVAVAGSGGIAAPAGGDAGVSRGLGQRIDWC